MVSLNFLPFLQIHSILIQYQSRFMALPKSLMPLTYFILCHAPHNCQQLTSFHPILTFRHMIHMEIIEYIEILYQFLPLVNTVLCDLIFIFKAILVRTGY